MNRLLASLSTIFFASFLCLDSPDSQASEPYHPVHPDPILETWRWREFTELEGKGARDLVQTTDGTFWFVVENGLVSYDGIDWVDHDADEVGIELPILSICARKDGSLVVGTIFNLYRYNEELWEPLDTGLAGEPMIYNRVVETQDGELWAGTALGPVQFRNDGATLFTLVETAGIVRDRFPTLNISTLPENTEPSPTSWGKEESYFEYLGAIVEYVQSMWVVVSLLPEGSGYIAGLRTGDIVSGVSVIASIPEETGGIIPAQLKLAVTRNRETLDIEIDTTFHAVPPPVHNLQTYEIYETAQGDLWFGLNHGLVLHGKRRDSNGSIEWNYFSAKDGIDQADVPIFQETQDGTLWMATTHSLHGISQFDGNDWTAVPESQRVYWSLLETSDQMLWAGGMSALFVFHKGEWQTLDSGLNLPIPSSRMKLLESMDGALWILGIGQSAIRFDRSPQTWQSFSDIIIQATTDFGREWFLHRDGGVVLNENSNWIRFGQEDGLIDTPNRIFVARDQTVWASGSHDGVAAISCLNGDRWEKMLFDGFSWNIDRRAVAESDSGDLWFGGSGGQEGGTGGCILFTPGQDRKIDGQWRVYTPPNAPESSYGIGVVNEDNTWFIGYHGVFQFDGQLWKRFFRKELLSDPTDSILVDMSGTVWIGSRRKGVFSFNGTRWSNYDTSDGLPSSSIMTLMEDRRGNIWIQTPKGPSVFDGKNWQDDVMPILLKGRNPYRPTLQTDDGTFWLSRVVATWFERSSGASQYTHDPNFGSIRNRPDEVPPRTQIHLSLAEVAYPGYIDIHWEGVDFLNDTPSDGLVYSYRLNKGPWSPYKRNSEHIYLSLPDGTHTFEVRARDQNLNVETVPAAATFRVFPPVWRQPWFVFLILAFVSGIGIQTARLLRRDESLLAANKRLEQRVMERTSDLTKVTDRLEKAQRVAVVGSWEWNMVDNQLYGSSEFYRIFGVDRDAFKDFHNSYLSAVHPDDRESVKTKINDALHRCKPFNFEHRIMRPGGGVIVVHSMAEVLVDERGKPNNMLGTVQDITVRKKQESLRRIYEANYTTILEGSADAIVSVNHDQQIVVFNQGAEHIFGYKRQEVIGKPLHLLIPENSRDRHNREFARFRDSSGGSRLMGARAEICGIRKSGDIFQAEASISNQSIDGVQVLTAILRDVTQRKELEQQLLQSQKVEIIGQLASGVAHDFNNQLAAILFNIEMAEESLAPDQHQPSISELKENLEQIKYASKEAASLTRQLLTFSRKQVVERRFIQLEKVLRNMTKMLTRLIRENIHMEIKTAPNLASIYAGESQIEQVIVNLVVNGSDAMPTGGLLRINAENLEVTEPIKTANTIVTPGKYVTVRVKDSGIGIKENIVGQIFEPFFTSKPVGKGTGLGLATVQRIVTEMKGVIAVSSIPDQGTEFTVYLPAFDQKPDAIESKIVPNNQLPSIGVTILYCEDDDLVRRATRKILEKSGYTVLEAANGTDALEIAKGNIENINLLISDVIMPDFGGRKLFDQLTKSLPELRGIFVSGYTSDLLTEEGIEDGHTSFLQKPFSVEQLFQRIGEILK